MVTSNNVTLSTAVNMGYYWYEDAENRFRDDGIVLPYFKITVPMQNHRLGVSLRSVYSGNLDTGAAVSVPVGTDTLYYDASNRKTGNIYRMGLEYAYKNEYFNIGTAVLYYLGNDIHYEGQDIENSGYVNGIYEIEKRFSGMNWTAGISRKFGNLAIGASFEPSLKLDGDQYYRYNHSAGTDTLSSETDLFEIPASINSGVTFLAGKTLKLNCDLRYRFWSNTEISYVNSFTKETEFYQDSWRIGGGISYDPLIGYGKWYESIPLRGGVNYARLPFRYNGEDIMELGLSAGSSLQLNSPGRKLDFAFKYTTRNNGISGDKEDQSFEFSVGITGIDIFKKSPKRTGERDIPRVDPGMGVLEDTQ
jgi:long-subunit fatty acid transport protein